MILQRFEAFAQQLYIIHSPQLAILPILSQFNFIRALLANMDTLSLSSKQMGDDALSPFNSPHYHRHGASPRLPDGLRPTALQSTTLHHPWIDLLPMPEMRDNLFRRGLDCFDEEKFCHALRGRIPGHDPGMLIWGEPWDPNGWEVTEAFARTWGFYDLLMSGEPGGAKSRCLVFLHEPFKREIRLISDLTASQASK